MSGLDSDQPGREMSPFVVEHDRGASPRTEGHALHAGGWSNAPQGVGKHTRKETRASRNAGADQVAYPPSTERRTDSYWHRPALASRETVTNVVAPVQGLPVMAEVETLSAEASTEHAGARSTEQPAGATLRRHRRFRRPLAFLLPGTTALVLGLGGGVAYAVLTASGSGTGRATVGNLQAISVVSATGTPATILYPGHSANLHVTVTNPNGTLTVYGIAPNGTVTVVGTSGCTKTTADVSVATNSSLAISLPHGKQSFTVATGASMTTASNTACQGASFHIPVTVKVKS
jgi:hypothetical protein